MNAGQVTPYDQFLRAFKKGIDCPELFNLRNAAKSGATAKQVADMNDTLRSVQCFSSTSKRAVSTKNDGTFTVKEYRIYRAIASAPMSVSESQSMRDAAKTFVISEADIRRTTDKVMGILSKNNWFATPAAEIKHASDWKGEKE